MTWDGTSLTRPNPSVLRAPDNHDWARLVQEIQNLQNPEFELSAKDTILIGNIIDSEIKLASSDNNNIMGIAVTDGTPGTLIHIKTLGVVVRSDWTPITGTITLSVGVDYFLVPDGKISIIPPNTGWTHKVGYALTPSEFIFLKQTSVRL